MVYGFYERFVQIRHFLTSPPMHACGRVCGATYLLQQLAAAATVIRRSLFPPRSVASSAGACLGVHTLGRGAGEHWEQPQPHLGAAGRRFMTYLEELVMATAPPVVADPKQQVST